MPIVALGGKPRLLDEAFGTGYLFTQFKYSEAEVINRHFGFGELVLLFVSFASLIGNEGA